jgi:hypothetical protein
MRIDSAGNVGIGTDSPTNFSNGTVVEAAGGSNTGAFLASSNSGTVVAEMQGNNADGLTYFGSRTNHPVVFRQNGTERMRIDSSGNLLVGTTSTGAATASNGAYITPDGQIIGRSNSIVSYLNRRSTDGQILQFMKDGTSVGSIGVASGDNLYIAGGSGNTKGLYLNDSGVVPANTGGAPQDNASDLGAPSVRFKDAYLSGGIYLGGVGSANKLDEYEEGEFTLVLSGSSTAGTNSGGSRGGRYTKVGRLVTCNVVVANTTLTGASGSLQMTGFPFTAQNYANRPPVGVIRMYQQDLSAPSDGYFSPVLSINHNTNVGEFVQTRDNGTWSVVQVENTSGLYFEGTISYTTDS